MRAADIFSDTEHNRLHLVIHRPLERFEVDNAILRVRSATERLRPGFSITVQQELNEPGPGRFSAVRLARCLDTILRAADDRLVA